MTPDDQHTHLIEPLPDRSLHLQCACTLLVSLGAAYVSYRHGREFALRFDADDTTATLWPLIVDGLVRRNRFLVLCRAAPNLLPCHVRVGVDPYLAGI